MNISGFFKTIAITVFLLAATGAQAIGTDDMAAIPLQQGVMEDSGGGSSLIGSFFAGSAVGSLFGYPSTGLGVIDLALGCLVLFVMFRLILHFGVNLGGHHAEEDSSGENGTTDERRLPTVKEQAASAWDRLRSLPDDEEQSLGVKSSKAALSLAVPEGFDADDFLEGAKLFFTRLQTAWAARDLGDLAHFLTPEMLAVLQEQGEQHPHPTYIAVILVTPTLLEVSRTEEEERVKVLFNALLSEGQGDDSQTFDVREIWYFVQDRTNGGSWQLDGIEQVVADG